MGGEGYGGGVGEDAVAIAGTAVAESESVAVAVAIAVIAVVAVAAMTAIAAISYERQQEQWQQSSRIVEGSNATSARMLEGVPIAREFRVENGVQHRKGLRVPIVQKADSPRQAAK